MHNLPSETDFRLLVESIRDYAIFMLDPDGQIRSWNAGAECILGYCASEIIGKYFSCLYPVEAVVNGKPQQELQLATVAGQCEDEGWRVRKSGTQVWVSALISTIRDQQGQLLGFSAIARELTERVQVEKQLCHANRNLSIFSECHQALIRDTNEADLLRDICRIMVEIGGYCSTWVAYAPMADDKCQGKPSGEKLVLQAGHKKAAGALDPSYPLPFLGELSTAVLQTGIPYRANDILNEPEFAPWHSQAQQQGIASALILPLWTTGDWAAVGTQDWENACPLPVVPASTIGEAGRLATTSAFCLLPSSLEPTPNQSCFGVLNICSAQPGAFDAPEIELLSKLANDLAYGITARRASQERLETEAALRAREQQLRAIFDGSLEAMAIADDRGQYVEVNPAACELFGLPKAELLRHSIVDFSEPGFDFSQAWATFLQEGRARGEFRLNLPDGTIREVEYSASASFLPNRHLSVIRDITARKQAEAQLQQYRYRLEALVTERTAKLTAANEQLQQEIASRVRVEAALRESSQQLRTLINAMPDIVCFKDGAGKWLEANQAMLQLFDINSSDYQGLTDAQLATSNNFYRDSLLTCERSDRQAWEKRTLYRGEEAIPKPDGTVKIYDILKVPLFHADGKRQGLVVLGRDITERKQSEQAFKRLAAIVESSDDAIIGKRIDGTIDSWNAGAERIYGYTATEILGQSISLLASSERPNEMPQILASIRAGGSIDHYETVHLRKDGKQIDVSLTICPIKDAEGRAIGVSTIARDVSDRKRVETALEQLRHQNELILDSAGDGICGLNRQGKITFINSAVTRMTGYELRELIDQPLHLSLHHTKTNQSPTAACEPCQILTPLQDGVARHVTHEVFWRKDGSHFPVEYVASPIRDKGEIIGAVVTFKDITERLVVERMKDEFISVVSHELRTPLTSIHGALGLLASGLLDVQPQRAKRMLEIAVTNTDRLVRLINDILDLERMKSSHLALPKQICHLSKLMLQAVDEMQAMAERAGVTLLVVPVQAQLWAAPDRLLQALTNLLSNAIKFSSVGASVWLTGTLTHQARRVEEQTEGESPSCPLPFWEVTLAVKDEGRGIPADKLETIFERFQQVDASDSRQKGGTGLGLAISRSIVEQHGGRIWAESVLGEGSTFFLTLPVMVEEERSGESV